MLCRCRLAARTPGYLAPTSRVCGRCPAWRQPTKSKRLRTRDTPQPMPGTRQLADEPTSSATLTRPVTWSSLASMRPFSSVTRLATSLALCSILPSSCCTTTSIRPTACRKDWRKAARQRCLSSSPYAPLTESTRRHVVCRVPGQTLAALPRRSAPRQKPFPPASPRHVPPAPLRWISVVCARDHYI